jgi:hypothetical protein
MISRLQGMNVAKDGWYTELGSMWPGQGLSLKVKEVLYKGKSQFQVRSCAGVLLLAALHSFDQLMKPLVQKFCWLCWTAVCEMVASICCSKNPVLAVSSRC